MQEATHTTRKSANPISLFGRLGFVGALAVLEAFGLSFAKRAPTVVSPQVAGLLLDIHEVWHWILRFFIALMVSLIILLTTAGINWPKAMSSECVSHRPVWIWWGLHGILLAAALALFSVGQGSLPVLLAAAVWPVCGIGAGVALLASLASLKVWWALTSNGRLVLYASMMAGASICAIKASQFFWSHCARLTFHITAFLLRPLYPDLRTDSTALSLSTDRFGLIIADTCSGLEGVGLMLAFCGIWLWCFRREYRFPRALLIIPAAATLVFILNAFRIGLMLIIGDRGYPDIADAGFHSQAGWIAFNLSALAVVFAARHLPSLQSPRHGAVNDETSVVRQEENPTRSYILPLVAILAVGMLCSSVSDGFDSYYPARLVIGGLLLWRYRSRYRDLDWRFTWRSVLAGTAVGLVWIVCSKYVAAPQNMPISLAQMPVINRDFWIISRILAGTVTVPIAEELAYRGFLMRRLVRGDFQHTSFREVGPWGLWVSAIAFGVVHGRFWTLGILAGLVFGLLAIRTNRFGEAVMAHAIANALLAACVLSMNQWQLW